jgi:UDP-glucose 4-epimerase
VTPTGKRTDAAADPTRDGDAARPPADILITGGAGFIGSHLTEALLAEGHRVTVVDNLTTGRRKNLPAAHPALEIIESDLREALAGPLARRRFDEIYHLAAAVGVDLVMKDPVRHRDQRRADRRPPPLRRGTDAGTRGPRTFIASSQRGLRQAHPPGLQRGRRRRLRPHHHHPLVLRLQPRPSTSTSPSPTTTAACPVVVVRFFNTVGPRQVGEYGMVLPRFVERRHEGRADPRLRRRHPVPLLLRCPRHRRRTPQAPGKPRLPRPRLQPRLRPSDHHRRAREPRHRHPRLHSTIEFVPYADAYPPGFEDLKHRRPDLSRVREAIAFEPRTDLAATIADLAAAIRADDAKEVTR